MLKKRLAILLVLIFALVSCATFQTAKEEPFSTWSSKKKLTYAINIYKTEYDRYFAAAVKPNLTEGQRAYLKQKRKALVALDQTIELMIPIADSEAQIPADMESKLLGVLNLLGYQPM